MKRLALLVVALVFAFTTTVMAQGKPAAAPAAAEPAKVEKAADEKKVEKKAKMMAGYLVANFAVINPEGYKAYLRGVLPTLKAHGAEILVAEYESEALEGEPGSITMVFKFASKEALYGWYNSPEYQKMIHLRADSTKGIAVSAGEFDLAKNLRLLETLFR